MIETLYCPICHKKIGKGDLLTIAPDTTGRGTYWVRHFVSGNVPWRTSETNEEMWEKIDANPIEISYSNIRDYCGKAGFDGARFL